MTTELRPVPADLERLQIVCATLDHAAGDLIEARGYPMSPFAKANPPADPALELIAAHTLVEMFDELAPMIEELRA